MKVYSVYSIPKNPSYYLIGLFKTKEKAKECIKKINETNDEMDVPREKRFVYDIQIENVVE